MIAFYGNMENMEHFPQNGKYVRSQIHSRRGKNWGQVVGKEDVSVLYGNRYVFSKKNRNWSFKNCTSKYNTCHCTFFSFSKFESKMLKMLTLRSKYLQSFILHFEWTSHMEKNSRNFLQLLFWKWVVLAKEGVKQ